MFLCRHIFTYLTAQETKYVFCLYSILTPNYIHQPSKRFTFAVIDSDIDKTPFFPTLKTDDNGGIASESHDLIPTMN